MNNSDEEIVTAQYADQPNDLPLHAPNPPSGGLSLGCILSVVAGSVFCLILAIAVVGIGYLVLNANKQVQLAKAEVASLTSSSLKEAVEVFDGENRSQDEVQSHPDFDGINELFQQVADAADWNDLSAIHPYFDFKKYADEVRQAPGTQSFYRQYSQFAIKKRVQQFGIFIAPFSDWEIAKIQHLSSNKRVVYAQVQLSSDDSIKKCLIWVSKNRQGKWKLYDWENLAERYRSSFETANLIAEPKQSYTDGYNQYVDYIDDIAATEHTDPNYQQLLRKCENLKVSPKIRPSILLNIGLHWIDIDEPKQALRCIDQIQNKDLIPEASWIAGLAHEELEEYESAIEKYQEFVETAGAQSDVLQSLVNCFQQLEDTKRQQSYQLERFKAWPARNCYFNAINLLAFFQDEPNKLFNAIDCSSESQVIYQKLLSQLDGNSYALPQLKLVDKHLKATDSQNPLLLQRVAAMRAMAEGNRDEFQRLMIQVFQQDSEAGDYSKWTEATEYGFHRELFEATEDKAAAFEAIANIYLSQDWYASEASFDAICDSFYDQHPENPVGIYFKAFGYFEANKLEQAKTLFESIEGKMEGDFEYLNSTITKWQLKILLAQQQFDKAIELTGQKDNLQQLLFTAVEHNTKEVFSMTPTSALEAPSDQVLKGLKSLEMNQSAAADHFSNYLKTPETDYWLESIALDGLIDSQPGATAVEILQKTPRYLVYQRLAGILQSNEDWKALETLSETALKLLRSEYEEELYRERYTLANFNEAQWHQQKYRSILNRYQALTNKEKLGDISFVLWSACHLKNFRLAREICEQELEAYGTKSDFALVAAFEQDVDTFEAATSELDAYEKSTLDETLLSLRVEDRFRRLLYQKSKPIDLDYRNSRLESLVAMFPSDWSVSEEQIRSALANLSGIDSSDSESKFELIALPNTNKTKTWAAKTQSCGVLIKLQPLSNNKFSTSSTSPFRRRINAILSAPHQHITVSVFPIAGKLQSSNSPSDTALGKTEPEIPPQPNYYEMAASLFVSIADQSPLALDAGEGWSDQKVLFERVKSLAAGKPFKKLGSIDSFYTDSVDVSENEYSHEHLEFQNKLARTFERYKSATDPKTEFTATLRSETISVEKIDVKLDSDIELSTYAGAIFRGTVTQESQPFGIYKTGDRLEFTDAQIENWKIKIGGEVESGQAPKN